MDKKSKDFLYKYLNNPSPTGHEAEGQKIWLDYIKPYVDTSFVDNYGTAVAVVNPEAPYKVVIEAHADEIAWYVNYITPEGYIYVIRNGGSDHQIAPSKRVLLHGENGVVEGVFGWPAIHTRKPGKEANPSLENIFIDVGAASKEEVEEMGIVVGTVITYEDELRELNKGRYFSGRALDNRIGGFMIAEVARRLNEEKHEVPFGLYVVNAVQEEVGLRGAEMITQTLKPNVAIVTDVCHDSSAPMYNKQLEGDTKGGNGPVLTVAPAVQNNLFKMLVNTAKEKEIPFQRAASSRVTGTDTDAFAYSNGGVPSALISLPLKYMHTTVETAHADDIENTIKLMTEFLKQLPNEHDFRYIK
ncbi:M42 family metallopeptidase [Flammeovirga aprica]|uniref:M42 family metallopeptidase n=1 Tax=Flammeovirga aprica JL-4 TaxID=694437 RepID=A0A7X9RUY6_9BACT|nr:M42 family metallopeptidase [Flammeovirga aprica]NME69186.1 M42 family metallopeptidase [Flammeovirga aprica JL-4]